MYIHVIKLITMVEKLVSLSKDDQLKIIYMWVKQQHITLTQFKLLIGWWAEQN